MIALAALGVAVVAAGVPTPPSVDTGDASSVVLFMLAGGGAIGIYTLVRAYLALRDSVDVREGKAIANLERWRIQADERADRAERRAQDCDRALADERAWGRYWQMRTTRAERALSSAGLDLPTPPRRPDGVDPDRS